MGPRGNVIIADDANDDGQEDTTSSYDREWKWFVYPEKVSRNSCFALEGEGLSKMFEILIGNA